MEIAVIGSNGFLGSEISKILSKKNIVTNITKQNISEFFNNNKYFDCVVNANGNSKKFWANNNPLEDFELSTRSVYESVIKLNYGKYIYISSVDASHMNMYGLNKRLSEEIVKSIAYNWTILRCSSIVGRDMKKGFIKDILDGTPLYVSSDSSYQFITNTEIANIVEVMASLQINKVFEVAGIGALTVENVAKLLNKGVKYNTTTEKLFYNQDISELSKYYIIKTSKEYLLEAFSERMD